MNVNFKKLMKLAYDNPDLPVVPVLNCEVVPNSENCHYMASFGCARLDKYLVCESRIHFYSDRFCFNSERIDIEEIKFALDDFGIDLDDIVSTNDNEVYDLYERLPWVDAIIVSIDTP